MELIVPRSGVGIDETDIVSVDDGYIKNYKQIRAPLDCLRRHLSFKFFPFCLVDVAECDKRPNYGQCNILLNVF